MISEWSALVLSLLVVFFGLTLIAGYIGAKRTKKGFHEFYVAGGTLSAITVMFTYMATYMEAWEFVGMPAVMATEGYEWWAIEVLSFIGADAVLFYLIALRVYKLAKKFNYITPIDYITHRVGGFEKPLRMLLAILIIYATIIYIGMIYIPAAGVLSAATGGEIPYHVFLIIYVVFIVIYVSAGGMRAVAYADIMAGVAFLVAFVALIFGIHNYWGGFTELAWSAYTTEISPHLFERTLPHQYFLSMYVFYGISWLFIPHLIVRFYAAKDFKGVIVGGIGTYVSLFVAVTISPLLIGLSIIALYGEQMPEVEVVEGLIPLLFENLYGRGIILVILLLGLIAITRSTIDSMLLAVSSIIDVDVLDKTLNLKIEEKKRRFITTLIIVLVAVLSILVALAPEAPMVIIGFQLCWPAYSVIAWPAIVMTFWPRANKYGGFASYLAGFASLILFTYVIWPEAPHNPFGLWEGTLPTIIALLTLVVVSLLTPPPPKEFLKEYYD